MDSQLDLICAIALRKSESSSGLVIVCTNVSAIAVNLVVELTIIPPSSKVE